MMTYQIVSCLILDDVRGDGTEYTDITTLVIEILGKWRSHLLSTLCTSNNPPNPNLSEPSFVVAHMTTNSYPLNSMWTNGPWRLILNQARWGHRWDHHFSRLLMKGVRTVNFLRLGVKLVRWRSWCDHQFTWFWFTRMIGAWSCPIKRELIWSPHPLWVLIHLLPFTFNLLDRKAVLVITILSTNNLNKRTSFGVLS